MFKHVALKAQTIHTPFASANLPAHRRAFLAWLRCFLARP
jgi:hypothetical protein